MFKNYFKVGIRNILKYKAFSFINIFGLALAMSVGMLIILMLADQKSYDQFHEKKDRIYRILSDRDDSKFPSATTPFPVAEALENYSLVEETTHLSRGLASDVTYDKRTLQMQGYFADPAFFKVFDFKLEHGSPENALSTPNSIVVTKSFARRLFNEGNPLGKIIAIKNAAGDSTVYWGDYIITGVIAGDKYKSHLKFDALVSGASIPLLAKDGKIAEHTNDWRTDHSYTYVVLAPGKTGDALAASLNDLTKQKKAELQNITGFGLKAQPLTEITPGIMVRNEASQTLPMAVYYFLSALALAILVSACLNYANLSTARALARAKEIGVRKVTGAFRKDLIFQFLSEAILTATLALALAMLILLLIKAAFLDLWINQHLEFSLDANIPVYAAFAAFALFTGLLAGLYPAIYLSRFQPIKALKNNEGSTASKFGMRKVLAVCQFVVSLFFITTSLLLFKQFSHFMKFDYGFNPASIINVPLQGNDYQKIAHAFSTVPGISTISACNYAPSTGTNNGTSLRRAGTDDEYQQVNILITDENFIENLEIKLIAGKPLSHTDSAGRFVLVNEAAVNAFGYRYPFEIVGQALESKWSKEPLEVVGVTRDFFVKDPMSAHEVSPLVMRNQPGEFSYANIKIISPDLAGTIEKLEREWERIDGHHPFQYDHYDEQLASRHRALFDLVSIIGFVAFISISIACLGLLGMSAYTAERKKKEVGIRKVLGAREFGIALLLSKDFLTILLISIFLGAPLSFFVNNLWLQRFPNRVEFGLDTMLFPAALLLILGLLTIGSQTLRASKSNPAETLKME